MMRFYSLDNARAFFNLMHTDHEIQVGQYYHLKVMDIAIANFRGDTHLKVFCHESGSFFIIGDDHFVDEAALCGDAEKLPYWLVAKLQYSVSKGFMPYAVMAAIHEYRQSTLEVPIDEAFPGIFKQFGQMLELVV